MFILLVSPGYEKEGTLERATSDPLVQHGPPTPAVRVQGAAPFHRRSARQRYMFASLMRNHLPLVLVRLRWPSLK